MPAFTQDDAGFSLIARGRGDGRAARRGEVVQTRVGLRGEGALGRTLCLEESPIKEREAVSGRRAAVRALR